jgi:hypothetical protein
MPQVLSLTPLVNVYNEVWRQLTALENQRSQHSEITMESDEVLIEALVYASYQIPRLICIAHSIWFELRKLGTQNRGYYIEKFEQEAIEYYGEMIQVWKEYDPDQIAHIILACGVHWRVYDKDGNVPGTNIPWEDLIQRALIFPYLDDCYIFPFTLIWRVAATPGMTYMKAAVKTKCAELVPNLDVKDLFISSDDIFSCEIYDLGLGYETIFASSLAVKYYLSSISTTTNSNGYFRFPMIYDIHPSDPGQDIMNNYLVNFSEGVSLPLKEVFAGTSDLGLSIVHNKNIPKAHHDLILPARTLNMRNVNIAVQAKASFKLSSKATISDQYLVSPNGVQQVQQLFWLYLGNEERETKYPSIVFLNGSGCCHGLALDFLILVKRLKSLNQRKRKT